MNRPLMLSCLLTAVVGCASTSRATRTNDPTAGGHYTLDNGLEVVLVEDRRAPLVAVNLTYHVGSMHDGAHAGLAHLAEHLMFRGTRNLSEAELRRAWADAGAIDVNASTFDNRTSYDALVVPEKLPAILWIEADRMAHVAARLDTVVVAEERDTIIDEWRFRIESKQFGPLVLAAFDAAFPADHPHHRAHPGLLAQRSLAEVREFMRRHHGPANATLVIVGDLPPGLRGDIERYFGGLEGGQRPEPPALPRTPPRPQCSVDTPPTVAAALLVWPSPGLYDEGDAEADMFAELVRQRLVPKLGQAGAQHAITVDATQASMASSSLFVISMVGEAQEQARALELVDQTLAELRTHPASEDELERARRRLRSRRLGEASTVMARAAQIQRHLAHGRPPDWLTQDLARYDRVDASSLAFFQARTITAVDPIVCRFEGAAP